MTQRVFARVSNQVPSSLLDAQIQAFALMSISAQLTRKYQRLRDVASEAGFYGAAVFLTRNLVQYPILNYLNNRFDRKYGTDTTGRISPLDLDFDSEQASRSTYYQATDDRAFFKVMRMLRIRHEEFVFIDLGSGKGIVTLLASNYPFKRIVGVELSKKLHDIATNNLRIYRSPRQRCADIELVEQDASTYEFPAEPLVVFLNNPFNENVVAAVVARLEESLRSDPRLIYFVYLHPNHTRQLEESSLFLHVREEEFFSRASINFRCRAVIYESTT